MSDFNADQVLAEAYTLYKKHHDGMGLDFKIAIAQVREESEQRGKEQGWDEGCAAGLSTGLTIGEISMGLKDQPIPAQPENPYRADLLEGDDE